jgi:inositol transport system substrate-binding protein
MIKKLVAGLAITSLSFLSLFGCSNNTSNAASGSGQANGKVTIGVAMSVMDDPWLTYLTDSMKQAAGANKNINLVFADANNDSNKQLAEVENFINQKVKAIIVNAVDPSSMAPILKAANDAKIPLIAVNREFPNLNQATSYVGSQSIQAGTLEMEGVAKALNGKGNIAIIEGQLGQEAEVDRTKGYYEVLKKYPNIHVVLTAAADWDRAKGMSLMENWLHSGKHIDAVVSNNDEMGIGAAKAIDAAGMKGKILVAGVDATPQGLGFVKSGDLILSVYQSALGQGTDSVKLAYDAATGKKVKKLDYIPYELVKPADVTKYMNIWSSLTGK